MIRRGVTRWARAAAAGVLAAIAVATPAAGAEAFFPGLPATQVVRDLTLAEAAQRGMLTLEAKGGDVGDVVAVELRHRQVRGPIRVTLRVEFTLPSRITDEQRATFPEQLEQARLLTENELNRLEARTRSGDPIRFRLEWRYRPEAEPPSASHHQIQLLNPLRDLPEPDPDFRSRTEGLGVPNTGVPVNGRFRFDNMASSGLLAHESLHMAGLDDRYLDYYRVGGRDHPLPDRGMSRQELAAWARAQRPPLPPPPAGGVVTKTNPGIGPCDIMGDESVPCRRISTQDADWFDSQAGVSVTAEPGDLLLNKDPARQNFGIGFRTVVMAAPGSTTRANGISAYCIDKDRFIPLDGTFDVAGPARDVPGHAPLAALLELSGRIQPSLDDVPPGMLNAVWHVTDAQSLEFSGSADESRSLLAAAGVPEGVLPGGLDPLPNPNAGSPATGAVSGGAVLPAIPAAETVPPAPRLTFARITPARVVARRPARVDLIVAAGAASAAEVALQRKAGRRWATVRSVASAELSSGLLVRRLALGRLPARPHRLAVTVLDDTGASTTRNLPLSVRRAR